MRFENIRAVDLGPQHERLAAELREAVERVLRSGRFVGGPEVERFEDEFAAYCGVRYCVATGSGTDALAFALRAVGVREGDAVLTTPFTFVATVEAIEQAGGRPVFADVHPEDLTLDPTAALEVASRTRPRAVVPVHLYGCPADLQALQEVAETVGAELVEDAAQAHGAEILLGGEWRKAGSVGRASAFSFYPTKNLGAVGDGGAVTTDDPEVARCVRLLRDHGQTSKYRHELRGARSSRMDEIQAAVLRLKLRYLDAWNEERRQAANYYDRRLAGSVVACPPTLAGRRCVYHLYTVRIPSRDEVQGRMSAEGVETGVHYPLPVHRQPAYRHLGGEFPVADAAAQEVLSLPLWVGIPVEALERVASALLGALQEVSGQGQGESSAGSGAQGLE
ncbi:MAG: glutamine--scyllo-inositol aminotransferase [Candidatus Binatia bacterium]|nr:MAG: glutamine--scyllo-inositol aminotransferase [Candidatus Binatia bacterium]